MLQDERDELKRECKILKEKCKENDHISSANMDLMKKMRAMQEQLYNEQDISRDKLRKLREVGFTFKRPVHVKIRSSRRSYPRRG